MKRPAVQAVLLLLVLTVVSLLSHVVSGCSTPSATEEPRNPAAPHPVVVLRGDEPHRHRRDAAADETGTPTQPAGEEVEGAEGRTARADDDDAAPSATTTASARGEDDQSGVARSRHWTASSSRSPQLLRSKLARRVLARAAPPGEGAADSARASCGSSDVHNGCPPHQ
ncbi:unnamed protein product [Urochloa humidicola]